MPAFGILLRKQEIMGYWSMIIAQTCEIGIQKKEQFSHERWREGSKVDSICSASWARSV